MNAPSKVEVPTGLALLRQPFTSNQISKLPKETKAQAEARKNNREGINCTVCGGWHHPRAVHLDYVGHAALTDRLLEADPHWNWEPVAFGPDGLPAFDRNNCLWIRLTVCGVTRLGYGSADGKSGGDAIKEVIGDALRNAAMRFGAALDLWHKGDLHADEGDEGRGQERSGTNREVSPAPVINDSQWAEIVQLVEATGTDAGKLCNAYSIDSLKDMTAEQFTDAKAILSKRLKEKADA